MKSPLAGNDFMSAGEWYSYNDTPGDTAMKNFSSERDLKPNGLITYIKEARKYGHFLIQSPMDYPPDWMLTNIEDLKKQDVDWKYFPALAKYYLRYIQEYKKQGVNIDYLSLFNEPGIYTKIPYSKIETLLADHVGPLFKENHIETKIQMCEANHRLYGWNYFPQVLQNEKAAQYIGGLAFHGYDYQRNFDKIAELKQNYPQYPIWMTEVCHAYVCGYPKSKPLPNYDYSDGDYWGNEIISDLESGVSGWIYWNMILDENGGPWLVSEHHGNPGFNAQQPVVVVNRKDKTVHYTALYYYLSHFSRYVRPGYVRIGTYENMEGIRAIAFLSPENKTVLQVLNSTDQNKDVKIRFDNRQVGLTIPAGSINTVVCQNIKN
jgi:glucosylceramidase